MKKSHRPRSPRTAQLALVAAPLLVVLASVLVAFRHAPANPEQRAASAWVPASYLSSDPSLPRPGTYSLPAEPAAAVDTF